jgi:hypothetical protein
MAGLVEETIDHLSALPSALLGCILSRLLQTPEVLLHLSLCSKELSSTVDECDEVWRALCLARGWHFKADEIAQQHVSWAQRFRDKQRRLCRDCGTESPYVFTLLRRRLCEPCESNPRYRLVTAAQALELLASFPSPAALLATLPSKEVKGVVAPQLEKKLRGNGQARFYLLAAVEALVRNSNRKARAPALHSAQSEQFQFDDDDDDRAALDAPAAACSDSDGETEGDQGRRRGDKLSAEEQKAARKAAKAATKAANRERRASKGESGASPLATSFSRSVPSRASGNGGKPGARIGARPHSFGTSPQSSGPLSRALVDEVLGDFAVSGLELCDA